MRMVRQRPTRGADGWSALARFSKIPLILLHGGVVSAGICLMATTTAKKVCDRIDRPKKKACSSSRRSAP